MTTTISIAALADELDTTVRVSALCRRFGPQQVVHTAVASNARCVLHGTAADLIRGQITAAGL